jgi:hypothetical protein
MPSNLSLRAVYPERSEGKRSNLKLRSLAMTTGLEHEDGI